MEQELPLPPYAHCSSIVKPVSLLKHKVHLTSRLRLVMIPPDSMSKGTYELISWPLRNINARL